ncbi:MAG TPA: ABC transporter ATP-binding protein [Herpetosiphonaceae bacterium]
MSIPLIALDRVSRSFAVKRRTITAVDDLSLAIDAGEILCLVGESGCGKTTTGKLIAGLLAPSAGTIRFRGSDIARLSGAQRRAYRLGVQLIHQDPYAALNPAHTISETLAAPLRHHRLTRGSAQTRQRVRELLESVDLTPADDLLGKYPHQLSGGQRQRVAIARALTVNPALIVADEAVSMVDVSIRISLLKTLTRLTERMGLAVLFITHDLALATYFAWQGRIGVMYLGRLVELAPTPLLIERPQHPYTQALLAAVPQVDPDAERRRPQVALRSMDLPSLLDPPTGCPFHPRCPRFEGEICMRAVPELVPFRDGSAVACHPVQRESAKAKILCQGDSHVKS